MKKINSIQELKDKIKEKFGEEIILKKPKVPSSHDYEFIVNNKKINKFIMKVSKKNKKRALRNDCN